MNTTLFHWPEIDPVDGRGKPVLGDPALEIRQWYQTVLLLH
jgi:hypothetical protein